MQNSSMNIAHPITPRRNTAKRQGGAITLLVSLIVLMLMTIMTLYVAGVSLMDQRSSGNEARRGEAASAAEAGLNQAIAYYKARTEFPIATAATAGQSAAWYWNKDVPATGLTLSGEATEIVTAPITLTNGSTVQWARAYQCNQALVTAVCPDPTPADPADSYTYFVFRAQGESADGTATVEMEKRMAYAAFMGGGKAPDTPIIAGGSIGLGGNYNVVANPNGGGKGVPVSVWSSSSVTVSGSPSTCHQQGFNGTMCTDDYLSSGGSVSTDVVANDPLVSAGGNFPDDVFQYAFGVAGSSWSSIYDLANKISDCSTLNSSSIGLYWFSGAAECHITGTVGSASNPVTLVFQDADFRMGSNSEFNGIIFAFDTPPQDATPHTIRSNGNALVNGTFMANTTMGSSLNGTFTINYDSGILDLIVPTSGGGSGRCLSAACGTPVDVPGTWRDF